MFGRSSEKNLNLDRQPNRSTAWALILKARHRGYAGAYKSSPGVSLINCMVHIRREFERAFDENRKAAENLCVIASLLATCRNHDINPRLYLNDVIATMPYFEKAGQEEEARLLTHRWKEYHPEAIMKTQVRDLAK